MWRLVNKARRKNSPPKTSILFNGVRYFSDKDKAKILAEQIAEKSQNKSLSKAEQDRRKIFEQQYSDPLPDNCKDYNQPITLDEFDLDLLLDLVLVLDRDLDLDLEDLDDGEDLD